MEDCVLVRSNTYTNTCPFFVMKKFKHSTDIINETKICWSATWDKKNCFKQGANIWGAHPNFRGAKWVRIDPLSPLVAFRNFSWGANDYAWGAFPFPPATRLVLSQKQKLEQLSRARRALLIWKLIFFMILKNSLFYCYFIFIFF